MSQNASQPRPETLAAACAGDIEAFSKLAYEDMSAVVYNATIPDADATVCLLQTWIDQFVEILGQPLAGDLISEIQDKIVANRQALIASILARN
jgi:hypothetical protein